jgi:hypothetical protein
MASRYWVGGSANWDATAGTKWATTSGGGGGAAVPGTGDDVFFDANSGAVTVTITANGSCNNLDFSGFTGTFAGSSTIANIRGNVTIASGMTWTHTGNLNFNSTTSTFNITSNGKAITSPLIFNGVGGTWSFADDYSSTGRITITAGTVTANNKNITCGGISTSNNTNVRSLTMGSGTWTVTHTISFAGATNYTCSCSGTNIYCTHSAMQFQTINSYNYGCNIYYTGSGTFSFNSGSGILGNVYIQSGTGFSSAVNLQLANLDFTGFTGSWTGSTNFKISGNLVLGSAMTSSTSIVLTNNTVINSTHSYTFNGVNLSVSITDAAGSTSSLVDDFTIGSTYTFSVSSGSFNTNDKNVTCGLFISSGTFTGGSSVFNITGTGGVTSTFSHNSASFSGASMTIKFTNTSTGVTSCNIVGGTHTIGTVWFDRGASTGDCAMTGASITTITTLKDTGTVAHNLYFRSGGVFNIGDWQITGTSGNVVTIGSCGSAGVVNVSTHTLGYVGAGTVSCDYMNIQHSIATPASTWYAGTHSTDNQAVVNAGSGWVFTAPPAPSTSRKLALLGVG